MIRIGLTGSIGMGKSTVSAMFHKLGVPVFDADAEVRKLQGPDGILLPDIEKRFPGSTDAQGVDRQKLAQMVFGNPSELKALEKIIHPAVFEARKRFLKKHRSRKMVVLDIPLLFEKSKSIRHNRQIDFSIVVSTPVWKQASRVLQRPGMTKMRLKSIRATQMPDHVKRRRADHVVATGCLKSRTFANIRQLVSCLGRKIGG